MKRFNYSYTPPANGLPGMSSPSATLVDDSEVFYLSYNDRDVAIYGSDTTALVLAQMLRFYVLKGDHREALASAKEKGFVACMEYVKQNKDQIHHSDDINESKESIAALLKHNGYDSNFIKKALLAYGNADGDDNSKDVNHENLEASKLREA